MRRAVPWLIAGVIVLADRLTKLAVMRHIDYLDRGDWIEVFPGLTLTHVRNSGIAFSLFSDSGPLARIALHTVIGVAVVLIAWMLVHQSRRGVLPSLAFGLVLGGAVGNLVDRVLWGWVVDFIHVWVRLGDRTFAWPDFNVADSAITVGVTLLVLFEILTMRGREAADQDDPREPELTGKVPAEEKAAGDHASDSG
jgi:signal peptidase II